MTAHSRLAPSAADRWVHCPGSVVLSEQFPDIGTGESAAEGDAAHWVAFQMAAVGVPVLGDITPNGWAVDDAMLEGGRLYVNYVFSVVNGLQGMAACRFEKRVGMPSLHEAMYGTPDCEYFDGTVIHIFDYKYGHLEVSPVENWQCAGGYAAGVLDRIRAEGKSTVWIEQDLPVVIHIVQPRCYTSGGPIRTWSTTTGELRAMWNRLRHAAAEALGPAPRVLVGDHCKYCPARRGCAVFKKAGDYAKDFAGEAMPMGLKGHDLATELHWSRRQLATLQARVESLDEQAEHEIRTGGPVPGFEMQRAGGSEKWKVPEANVAAFGDFLGVDLRKKLAVLTPTQCKEILRKKKIDGKLIAPYIERIPGKYSLGVADYSLIEKAFRT